MAINQNIYPNAYKIIKSQTIDGDTVNSSIETSEYIPYLMQSDKLQYGTQWDISNIYCGFDPTIHNITAGAASHCILKFDGDYLYQYHVENKSYKDIINYRMFLTFTSNIAGNYYYQTDWQSDGTWKNIATTYNYTTSNIQIPYADPLTGENRYYNVGYTTSGSKRNWLAPITDINFKRLIIYPKFQVLRTRITYADDTKQRITAVAGLSSSEYDYKSFKPDTTNESEGTPAGTNYDSDLWNIGYKQESETATTDILTTCAGVSCDVYYGDTNYAYSGDYSGTESYTPTGTSGSGRQTLLGTYIGAGDVTPTIGNTNFNYVCFNFIAETVNPYSGHICYSTIPGIYFGINSIQYFYGCTPNVYTITSPYATFRSASTYALGFESPQTSTNANGTYITRDESQCLTAVGHTSMVSSGNSFAPPYNYNSNYIIETGRIYSFSKSNAVYTIRPATNPEIYSGAELWATLASFGCYVAASSGAASQARTGQNADSPYLYLGHMSDSGVTDGTFVHGTAIADEIQADWENPTDVTPFDPSRPQPDPSNPPTPSGKSEGKITGDTTTGIKDRFLGTGSIKYYALAPSDTAELKTLLWAQSKTFYESIQIAGKQSASIFDYISSFRYYPASVSAMGFTTDSASDIYLGTGAKFQKTDGTNYQLTQVNGFVSQFDWCRWDLSSFDGWRNNFLDYSPYCKMSMYLPYAGTFDLDLQTVAAMIDVTQATIRVSVCIDINTGSMTYYVDADDCLILNKTVKLGVDLPISGNDAIQQSTAILQTNYNNASRLIGDVSGIASEISSGSIAGIAASALQLPVSLGSMSLSTALANRQVPTQVGSFGGALSSVTQGQDPYITIYRQKIANPLNYGHTVGYLTDSTHDIDDLSGFTVCSNPDLSGITATAAELDMIRNILTSGFFA